MPRLLQHKRLSVVFVCTVINLIVRAMYCEGLNGIHHLFNNRHVNIILGSHAGLQKCTPLSKAMTLYLVHLIKYH